MIPAMTLLAAFALGAQAPKTEATEKKEKVPPQVQLVFSHGPHQGLVECLDCHSGIDKSKSLGEPHLPALAKCQECHEDKGPPVRVAATWQLTFSHADHLPKVKGDCTACHKTLPEPGAPAVAPPMSACTACHEHARQFGEGRCTPCHVDLKKYPLRPVTAFSHQGDFLRTHGPQARSGVQTCMVCHDQPKCAECHSATTRPFKAELQFPEKVEAQLIHRGDFVSRHTIELQADPTSCRRCHGSAFCVSCHREQNVLPLTGGRDPHPPGWASGSAHGTAARQDILSCAGCHDQGARSTCVTCHKFIDPHPAGWGQRHNKSSDVASNSMCRTCHTQ